MKWNNITKEKISYFFAGFALLVGFGLTIAAFSVPPVGEIHSTVLVVLGQCLVWSGAILGFNLSVKNGVATIRGELNRTINRRFDQMEADRSEPDPENSEEGVGG